MLISKKALMQYTMLYFMLIMNQTQSYRLYIGNNTQVLLLIVVLCSVSLLIHHGRKAASGFAFVIFLLISTIVSRILHGGIGLLFWVEMAAKILVTYCVVLIDPDNFLRRFVKTVVFFAAISIVGWIQQIAGLNILVRYFPRHPESFSTSLWDSITGVKSVTNYWVHGLWLYCTTTRELMRNIGLFTEPGIYQMVLNAAVFLLVFYKEDLKIDDKKNRYYLIVCIIALITTQSTSGYIGLSVIFIGVLLSNKEGVKETKNIIYLVLLVGVVVLSVDASIRGNDSIIHKAVISKFFGNSGKVDISASTGVYRMASIITAIEAMIKHPLGLGHDGWLEFSMINELSGTGGWPLKIGAILGVVPFVGTLYWIISPLKYRRKSLIQNFIVVFLYMNSSLAQSSAFYPTLIMVPVYLTLVYKNRACNGGENIHAAGF